MTIRTPFSRAASLDASRLFDVEPVRRVSEVGSFAFDITRGRGTEIRVPGTEDESAVSPAVRRPVPGRVYH